MHLLTLKELDKERIMTIIRTAVDMKERPELYSDACHRQGLLLLFQKTSTRTSLSFQSGIHQLGGYAALLDWESSNFGLSEIRYEAQYASTNCDAIAARLKRHEDLLELARYSSVPVINGCCDKYHPCQTLADLMTIYETAGGFSGVTLTYVGVHNNVANSLAIGCAAVGIKLLLVTPVINQPSWDEELMAELGRSGYVERTDDFAGALSKSDFVYTDTWIDMEFYHDPAYQEEKRARLEKLMPYQLNRASLRGRRPYIMHDMPIHPGLEIEEELIEADHSIIFRQAENRMHAQKALLAMLLSRSRSQ